MGLNITNRKIYTGDSSGLIRVLNADNGIEIASAIIASASRHNKEIAAINRFQSHNNELMVVTNWSGIFKVFNGN